MTKPCLVEGERLLGAVRAELHECLRYFKLLSAMSRLELYAEALKGPKTGGELAQVILTDQSVASRHLAALRAGGLIESERQGRKVMHRGLTGPLVEHLRALANAIEALSGEGGD